MAGENLYDPIKRRRRDDGRFLRLTKSLEIRLDREEYDDKQEHKPKSESPLILQAFYLCGFFKWTFREFLETPPWVRRALFKLLKEKSEDITQFIGFDEAAGHKQLRRMFPPKDGE